MTNRYNIQYYSKKGFTLIELLVVVAIISILTSIIFVAIDPSGQTTKSKDAIRLDSLKKLEKALELYHWDNGEYPQFSVHTINNGAQKSPFTSAIEPYIKIDLDNDLFGPYSVAGDPVFYYKASDQHYSMMLRLRHSSNSSKQSNDGGYYNSLFEAGLNHRHCREKYAGAAGNWWTASGGNRCNGGN